MDQLVSPPAVFVGPGDLPDLLDAASRAGCSTVADIADADAVVWFGKSPDELLPELHPGIRWLQLPDAGVERWLAAGVFTADRVVTSAAGTFGPQVAEHALALILACLRQLPQAARASSWAPDVLRGSSLSGAVVTVVGAGDVGRCLLRLLRPLGCRTVAVTLRGAPVPEADRSVAEDELGAALAQADVVVLAAPSTLRSAGMIDAARLRTMKSTAYLINVGRGTLVVTDDLLDALDRGQLGGAALDVTDPEPLPAGHRFWTHPRVLITPHTANPPGLRRLSFARRVEENCRRRANGRPLVGVVDSERGY